VILSKNIRTDHSTWSR